MKRVIKRIIIISIYLLILSGLIFGMYFLFFKPEPTCFDGILNQKEEKIDCGGPCFPCELSELDNLRVLWTKVLKVEDRIYDIVTKIKNPNQNYGSGSVPYELVLYNESGEVIYSKKGDTFILPNQTKFMIESRVTVDQEINYTEMKFDQMDWEKENDFQLSQLTVQNKEYRLLDNNGKGFSQVTAIVKNKTNYDFAKVDIDILLFDPFQNLLAVSKTDLRDLISGQERDFIVTWFDEYDGQVTDVQVEPETNVFDSSNYVPTKGGSIEPFQEY